MSGPVKLRECPKPPRFSSLDADGTLRIDCSSKKAAAWAAWPKHALPGGGFAWQPAQRNGLPVSVDADFVVTRCGRDENWLQHVASKPSVVRRAASAATRASGPDVVVLFVDSVSHDSFRRDFPKTAEILTRLNATTSGSPRRSTHYSFERSHSLPCCTKNWMYAALAGLYSPAKNGVYEPTLARDAPWVWSEFEAAGYVTHVSNNMCYPSELQDWWRTEDSPLLVNVSDHPMIDVFCKKKPERSGDGSAFFQTRHLPSPSRHHTTPPHPNMPSTPTRNPTSTSSPPKSIAFHTTQHSTRQHHTTPHHTSHITLHHTTPRHPIHAISPNPNLRKSLPGLVKPNPTEPNPTRPNPA